MNFILYLIYIISPSPQSYQTNLPHRYVIFVLPDRSRYKTLPSSIKINNNLNLHLFLDSASQLGKSKESNNQRVNVNRAFKSQSFLSPKRIFHSPGHDHQNAKQIYCRLLPWLFKINLTATSFHISINSLEPYLFPKCLLNVL